MDEEKPNPKIGAAAPAVRSHAQAPWAHLIRAWHASRCCIPWMLQASRVTRASKLPTLPGHAATNNLSQISIKKGGPPAGATKAQSNDKRVRDLEEQLRQLKVRLLPHSHTYTHSHTHQHHGRSIHALTSRTIHSQLTISRAVMSTGSS